MSIRRWRKLEKREQEKERRRKNCELGTFGRTLDFSIFIDGT